MLLRSSGSLAVRRDSSAHDLRRMPSRETCTGRLCFRPRAQLSRCNIIRRCAPLAGVVSFHRASCAARGRSLILERRCVRRVRLGLVPLQGALPVPTVQWGSMDRQQGWHHAWTVQRGRIRRRLVRRRVQAAPWGRRAALCEPRQRACVWPAFLAVTRPHPGSRRVCCVHLVIMLQRAVQASATHVLQGQRALRKVAPSRVCAHCVPKVPMAPRSGLRSVPSVPLAHSLLALGGLPALRVRVATRIARQVWILQSPAKAQTRTRSCSIRLLSAVLRLW